MVGEWLVKGQNLAGELNICVVVRLDGAFYDQEGDVKPLGHDLLAMFVRHSGDLFINGWFLKEA